MSVKLLMTWDILPGREQDYFEFVVRDFHDSMANSGKASMTFWPRI